MKEVTKEEFDRLREQYLSQTKGDKPMQNKQNNTKPMRKNTKHMQILETKGK